MQFVGQTKSGTFDQESIEDPLVDDENQRILKKFNWDQSPQLRSLSYIITLLAFPFFVTWTIIGTVWVSKSNTETPNCVILSLIYLFQLQELGHNSYLIFWLVFCYIIILSFLILMLTWYFTHRYSQNQKNNVLQMLRGQNQTGQQLDPEIYESMKNTLQGESQKTAKVIKTLNEYGIFFDQRGLYESEYAKMNGSIKTVRYCRAFGDIGFSRCNICLVDFIINEKLRQFP